MIKVINFKLLIRVVAISTTIISLFTYEYVQSYWINDLPVVKILSISPWIALFIIILITTNFTARRMWKLLKKVDSSLFPDLNGSWEGEITTEDDISIPARALIKQNLLETQLIIHTKTSKTTTLETTPSTESGEPKLYYIYRSLPKDPNWGTYTGSTIFDIRSTEVDTKKVLELSGYYFTDRKSRGRIRLQQTGNSVDDDVSFY